MIQVYELPLDKFGGCTPLFEDAGFDEMFIRSALARRQPARIVVDDPVAPSNALLCQPYEFYLAGDANTPSLRQFTLEAPAELGTFQMFHGFAPIGDAWKDALLEDFGDRLVAIRRWNYRWGGSPVMDWRSRLPQGSSVKPITAELAERLDREWNEHIGFIWNGYERFERGGFGFCLVVGEELASYALTDGVDDRSISMGVATALQFRRRGFARLVCSALIEESLRRKLVPAWGCEDRNTGSKALAASLGFLQDGESCQLSRPGYGPLTLSHGLWQRALAKEGIIVWTRL